ncbi:MAG: hypothetical protein QOI66_4566 [Myxococcales bacterium]|jgi:hypothetical protein|nr:hypothetical protein [Myxococcales bacterium]
MGVMYGPTTAVPPNERLYGRGSEAGEAFVSFNAGLATVPPQGLRTRDDTIQLA